MYQGYFHSWTDIDTVMMARENIPYREKDPGILMMPS
jgi:hypothetical protein